MVRSMRCWKCGQENSLQAKFCAECGQTISRELRAASPPPRQRVGSVADETARLSQKRRSGRVLLGMGGVGLLILIVVSVIGFKDGGSAPQPAPVAVAKSVTPPAPVVIKPKTRAELRKEAADKESLDETVRIAMAKVMENAYLAKGLNVDVNAIGSHHSVLRLKWILVSKVTAYQFTHDDPEMFTDLKNDGFKKFEITDGYDKTWTWDLT